MKMKWKVTGSMLVMALAAALIGGSTMAWFTDDTELAAAEFTAGTVVISAEGPEAIAMEGKFIDNVNPGDCAKVTWDIINEGTKAAELRVKLSDQWLNELPTSNVHYAPAPGSDWVMYEEDGEVWFYYTGGPIPGTYGQEEGAEAIITRLSVVIAFDGEATDNDYQGQTYEIKGYAEAVQASNNAPAAVWGDGWNLVTAEDYKFDGLITYFLSGPGQDMPCWKGNTEEPGEDEPVIVPDPEMYTLTLLTHPKHHNLGRVEGAGSKEEGSDVTVKATPKNGWYKFVKWTDKDGNTVSTIATHKFEMPSNDYQLTAHFTAILGFNAQEAGELELE